MPLTQLELKRLRPADAPFVDQFLRELSRRLMGRQPGAGDMEELLDASTPRRAAAWVGSAEYLKGRIHTASVIEGNLLCTPLESHKPTANERVLAELELILSNKTPSAEQEVLLATPQSIAPLLPSRPDRNRKPDMSPQAAAAMKAVMEELAQEAADWAQLHARLDSSGSVARVQGPAVQMEDTTARHGSILTQALRTVMALCSPAAEGTAPRQPRVQETGHEVGQEAAAHALLRGAREEAARALLSNHARVLRDVTNPSATLNIEQRRLTQRHLQRLPLTDRRYVDRFLRHVVRRLLDDDDGDSAREEAREERCLLDGGEAARQAVAWTGAATYLDGRIHSKAAQKPGRAPDMSPQAAMALREVLRAVSAEQLAAAQSAVERPAVEQPAVGEAMAIADVPPIRKLERCRACNDIFTAFLNESDAIVFTQAEAPHRITHVNKAWVDMCGYDMDEVEGKTNAVLQGPETDVEAVRDLMAHVGRQESAKATLVNYKKGGERFVNRLQIEPLYDDKGKLVQYMALLREVDPADLPRPAFRRRD